MIWIPLLFSISIHAGPPEPAASASESLPAADQQVCFSPDEACDEKLTEFISHARKSIDVAVYDINLDPLVHQLLLMHKKIKVRLVVDQRQSKGQHSLVSTLIKAGAQIRFGHQRGIMHNKFVLVDYQRLETGSFNYTHHASKANNENQVYLSAPEIVQRYQNRFDQIWEEAKPWK